jgi:hypothetical protein
VRGWIAGLLALVSVSAGAAPLATPVADRRPADQTYLTVPEWFLVFSPEEYARALAPATRSPSAFPFTGHIGQFWQSYRDVAAECAPLPANGGYHVMIAVIGISTTVEYTLKGVYEGVVGRFTELVAGHADTPEDRLGAKVAQDYVDFIKVRPWYEFDFATPAKALWSLPGSGSLVRRWERRYVLTSEYLVKAGYAKLIEMGTRSSYDVPIERTLAIVRAPAEAKLPADTKLIAKDGDRWLLDAPRRQAFQDAAIALARKGVVFEEIAGNRREILVTLVAAQQPPPGGRTIYTQPILTQPGLTRYAVAYPVNRLADVVRMMPDGEIEHVYDY